MPAHLVRHVVSVMMLAGIFGCTAVPQALRYEAITADDEFNGYLDGQGASARFGAIANLSVAADGSLLVADQGGGLIRKVDPNGEVWSRVLGRPEFYARLQGRSAHARYMLQAEAERFSPGQLEVDRQGRLWLIDDYHSCIRRIETHGELIDVPGTTYPRPTYPPPSTPDRSVLQSIIAFAVAPSGDLYVVDMVGDSVWCIAPDGARRKVAGGERGYADGIGGAAKFNQPRAIACDAHGVLYVGDTFNHRIRKVTPDGVVTTLAGGDTSGFVDGPPGSALLGFLSRGSLAVDAADRVWVADGRLRRVSPDGRMTTLAGQFQGAKNAVDFFLGETHYTMVTIGPDGRVFLADTTRVFSYHEGTLPEPLAGALPALNHRP